MATDVTLDDAPCPVIDSLKQIGSQWRLIVPHDLQGGEERLNELKRSTGANPRMLSRVFDDLWEHGFVDRWMEGDALVATYYSLTDKDVSLYPVSNKIWEWATEWLDVEREESAEGETVQSTT